jgi:hypothetical protein
VVVVVVHVQVPLAFIVVVVVVVVVLVTLDALSMILAALLGTACDISDFSFVLGKDQD